MKLSQVKTLLKNLTTVGFQLPDKTLVPNHFHVTEIGEITKRFIDCGGTVRKETVVNFQLYSADDFDHRLHPEKLLKIIELSEKTLAIEDHEIEVEYQGVTIQKFGLDFDGNQFLLTSKQTDCLAKDSCGIVTNKPKVRLSEMTSQSCCSAESNCC